MNTQDQRPPAAGGGCLGFLTGLVMLPVLTVAALALVGRFWPWMLGALLVGSALTAFDASQRGLETWRTHARLIPVVALLGALLGYAWNGLFGG